MPNLKQSTAVTVKIGPFVDNGDGYTPETGLTIIQADVQLSKNGGAFGQKTDATAGAHDADGWYAVALDTTDTGTLGRLQVQVYVVGALPVWQEFMVVPAVVYDSLVGGSDYLQVHAREIDNGLITAAAIATGAIDADAVATDALTAVSTANWNYATRSLTTFGTLVADIWSYTTRTLTSLSALLSSIAAAVWAYATRTLTSTASQTTAALTGSEMAVTKYVSFSATLTGLTIPADWTKIWLTAKRARADDTDSEAIIQVIESNPGVGADGMAYIEGHTPSGASLTAADASLTVNQSAGTIKFDITDDATSVLTAKDGRYDVKCLSTGAGCTKLQSSAKFGISETETRAIS
jgi:hypothetical protein